MSTPVLPPPFDQIGSRRFSFYPAIVGIEHNEWVLRKAAWSEVLVGNTKSSQEIWIPRRFLGEVSKTDEPVMILGLTKEVEYKAGQIIPHVRRVIEMPKAVNEGYRPPATEPEQSPAAVVGIRLESGAERRVGRLLLWVLAGGIVACLAVIYLFRGDANPRVRFNPVMQSSIGLTGTDDYFAVVRALGPPESDQWRSANGILQHRILGYPSKGFSVVLMGEDRDKAVYIGAVNKDWQPVDTVVSRGGKDTAALLRSLRPTPSGR